MKSRPAARFCAPSILALAVAQAFAAPALDALPVGGRITAGAAAISQGGARMDINQASERVVLEWERFDIGSAAQVNFAQPSPSAIALNRVLAGDASQIFGKLGANGQVWLVNPSGVVFGAGSRVDVGGLVASTLDIADADFVAGRHVFQRNGAAGKVVNRGTIVAADGAHGGLVALLAPEVRNEGIISARLGNVVLAAGERVTLEAGANGRLQVAVDPATLDTLVDNRHLIVADSGQVVMTAQAADRLYSAVVANSGTVQARTLENRDGRIYLLADMGHGEAKIGGTLDASAPSPLAGESRGEGANGGFIETSAAKVSLAADHRVVTFAATGKHGTWLIDPNDYTIGAGGNITGAQLSDDLGNGNVTISTATQGTAGGNGDIFVNEAVSWSTNTALSLQAERDIQINADITATGNTAGLTLGHGAGRDYYLNSGAKITLSGSAPVLKIGTAGAEAAYTVINNLGVAGDATTTTLQGLKNLLASGYFALGSDINASPTSDWNAGAGFEPINAFGGNGVGTFHGFGHAISGLYINRPATDVVGLFTHNNGLIRDVRLTAINITGRDDVGGLAGYNIETHNCSSSGVVSGRSNVGGLLGGGWGIYSSFSTATVSGSGDLIGGLVGELWGIAQNVYSTGAVSGHSAVGGLLGDLSGSLDNGYSAGAVSGTGFHVGGLIGINNGGPATNSYWNTTTSGQPASEAGAPLATGPMKQQASFTGWDFANTWRIYENQSYPVLRALQSNLTVTASAAAKTYDGLAYSGGNGVTYSIAGAMPAGTVAYGGTAQGAINVGSYALTPSGLNSDQRYHISYADGTLTVNKAPLTVTASNASKTYDGNAYAGGNGVAYSGFVHGETAAVLGGALAYGGNAQGAVNAGSYAITPSGRTAANYTISFVDGALTIDPAIMALGLAADNKNKTYGGADPALTWQINTGALQGGDSFSGSLARDAGENVGSYAIRQGTLTAGGNYAITFTNGVLTIAPRPLGVAADDQAKTYGAADPALTWRIASGSLVGDDSLSGSLARAAGENTGSYAIRQGSLANSNYAVSFNEGTLTVNQAPVTVTANAAAKTYDGLAYSGGNGASYSGFVNGDTAAVLGGTLAWGGSAQGAVNAGTYAITLGGLTAGNYALTFVAGTLGVAKAPLTVTASAAGKSYDGLAYSGGNGVSYSSFVNNETASVLGGTLAWGGSAQGAVDAGSYAISPAGLTAGNYALTFVDGTLSVAKAPLTVTANAATKFFDGLPYAGGNGVAYSGFVNSETAAVLGGALIYSGDSLGAVTVGRYVIAPSGLVGGNYVLSYVDGTLTIAPDNRPDAGLLARAGTTGQAFEASRAATGQGTADASSQLAADTAIHSAMLASAMPHLNVEADFIALPEER